MGWGLIVLVLVGAAAVAYAVVAIGRRRHVLVPGVVATLLIVGGIWIAGYGLMGAGWRDLDGWVDCYPACNGWHRAGAALFVGPPAVAVFVVVAALLSMLVDHRGIHLRR